MKIVAKIEKLEIIENFFCVIEREISLLHDKNIITNLRKYFDIKFQK